MKKNQITYKALEDPHQRGATKGAKPELTIQLVTDRYLETFDCGCEVWYVLKTGEYYMIGHPSAYKEAFEEYHRKDCFDQWVKEVRSKDGTGNI